MLTLSFFLLSQGLFLFSDIKETIQYHNMLKMFALVVCSRISLDLEQYILKPDTDPTVSTEQIQSSVQKPDNIKWFW